MRTMYLIICLALGACSQYRMLRVEVLQPAAVELREGNFLFVDRNIVHAGDTAGARELEEILGVNRATLVACLRDGLTAGLEWGARSVNVEIARSLPRVIATDSIPGAMPREEVWRVSAGSDAAYVVAVEHCKFRRVGREVDLDGNVLLRVYETMEGLPVDTLTSDRLAVDAEVTAGDYSGSIREFFYQKGWSLAEYLVPTWRPVERRVYTGHRLLEAGARLLEQGETGRAMETWTMALAGGEGLATRAAVNISWLLELDGAFEDAIRLLEERLERGGGTARAYIRERVAMLKQRQADSDRLVNQLY
ncbi:MAG: DUF6340 family protein [Odoribacteraceae bacterium]|jgi:hypothetical protein|nr:DUF6340 family protein [Odoribacteraceae bacterium]